MALSSLLCALRWVLALSAGGQLIKPSSDEQWLQWLDVPPPAAANAAIALSARADRAAGALLSAPEVGKVDVVCSGGGNLDAFYMGIRMILSRAPIIAPVR